jgi:crossover junction endodeoxyribonuclease RuvC
MEVTPNLTNMINAYYIGIDQSLTETAITVLNTPNKYIIYSFKGKGKNSLEKSLDLHDKIKVFFHRQFAVTEGLKPIKCFIEGGSYHSTGRLFSLGQLSGLIISIIDSHKIPFREIPPTILKKFMTGKGNANKNFVIKNIQKKYGIHFKNDNEADSYVLALMAYNFMNYKLLNKDRMEKETIYNLQNEKPKAKRKIYRRKVTDF